MAGSSLGADPMHNNIMETRLKLGVFDDNEQEIDASKRRGAGYDRVGFGLESQVGDLRKDPKLFLRIKH